MRKLTEKQEERRRELMHKVVDMTATDKEIAEFQRLQTRFAKWLQKLYPSADENVRCIAPTTVKGLVIAVNPRHGSSNF
jgi:hypothetical protein